MQFDRVKSQPESLGEILGALCASGISQVASRGGGVLTGVTAARTRVEDGCTRPPAESAGAPEPVWGPRSPEGKAERAPDGRRWVVDGSGGLEGVWGVLVDRVTCVNALDSFAI